MPTVSDLEKEARRQLKNNEGMAALRTAGEAVKQYRTDPSAHHLHGQVLERVGRYEDALAAYRVCVKQGGFGNASERVQDLKAALERPAKATISTSARSWRSALDHTTLTSIQNALHTYTYRGVSLPKNPFDLGLYPLLMSKLKPRTILEIGSNAGGSALWMGDLCDAMGLDCHIHSLDIVKVKDVKHKRVTFYEGDGRNLGPTWTEKLLAKLPRPWLVIEDADHSYETSSSALAFFDPLLTADDVLVIEDGIISDLSQLPEGTSGPHKALRQFLGKHFIEWEIIADYCDFYGYNYTWASNGFLRKTGLKKLGKDVAPDLLSLADRVKKKEFDGVLTELDKLKGSGRTTRGTDYLRAFCFWKLGRHFDALEAAKEEVRWFPDHGQARRLAEHLSAKLFPPPKLGNDEFKRLYQTVRPYTMLSEERLHSLYELARRACIFDVPGDFVECGVAGGGSCALLASVIAKHSRRPRRLFACDTFSGMPAPTDKDIHEDQRAENSGWGSGTCSAPTASLMEACGKLGVESIVTPVQGLFADTLPGLRDQVEGLAFLHMDGDWFQSTWDILVNLYERVQDGAAIQVDDYGYWKGCRDAVHQFEKERGLKFNIHVIDGTGVWFSKPVSSSAALRRLNLGCGRRFHQDWLNLDIVPAGPAVIQHNLIEPLPLDDATCSVVYHSHVLEHLPKDQAPAFLAECFRVLVPGGLLRIAVPDLETIARLYLENLAAAAQGDATAARQHEWMTIELVDQLTRHRSGGHMLDYWKQNPMPAEDFVLQRMGREAGDFIHAFRARESDSKTAGKADEGPESIGRFRTGGEVHQWMYDRVSLDRLLKATGFSDVRVCSASESGIANWESYQLDTDETGQVRKPDSLFIESRKPT
jgi:cephalosporin hydroxylase/predicted SAM-dependent methyltransferase